METKGHKLEGRNNHYGPARVSGIRHLGILRFANREVLLVKVRHTGKREGRQGKLPFQYEDTEKD